MRIDLGAVEPQLTRQLTALSAELAKGPLDAGFRELLAVHVSLLNRCAHCIAVHWKKAVAAGAEEARLRVLPAYRESGFFTPRELAALDLATSMTHLPEAGVPDALWESVCAEFPEQSEQMHLVYQIVLMNAWNRVSLATGQKPPRS